MGFRWKDLFYDLERLMAGDGKTSANQTLARIQEHVFEKLLTHDLYVLGHALMFFKYYKEQVLLCFKFLSTIMN